MVHETSRVFAQVLRADAHHKVELDSNLLRPKGFALPSNTVYLGDVAIALLASLTQPETPHFSTPPKFNEQRWTMNTTSGTLSVRILSDSYWGFGLFNSGYVNVIELTGPFQERMRVLFDLSASLGHNPWEFKHRRSVTKWLNKHHQGSSLDGNESSWREGMASARASFEASIEMIKQRSVEVAKRMKEHEGSEGWILEKAQASFAAAEFDLGIARNALADDNAPGLERALARVEASLIEADPSTELLSSDYQASMPDGMNLRNPSSEHSVPLDELEIVDLTVQSQEEE